MNSLRIPSLRPDFPMHCVRPVISAVVVGMVAVGGLPAAEPEPSLEAVRAAISNAIPLLEQVSRGAAENVRG
jgi:hypothetical protein